MFSFLRASVTRLYSPQENISSLSFIILPLNISKAGDTPVLACGVLLYAKMYLSSSCFQSFVSACAILMAFRSVLKKLSILEFETGRNGIIL